MELSAYRKESWTQEVLNYYISMMNQIISDRTRLIPYADLEDIMNQASNEWRRVQEYEELLDSPTLTSEGIKLNTDRIKGSWWKIIEQIKGDMERFVAKGMPRPGPKFQAMYLLWRSEVVMVGKRVVRCVPIGGALVQDLQKFVDGKMTVGALQETILQRGQVPTAGLKVIDDGTGKLEFKTAPAVSVAPQTAPAVQASRVKEPPEVPGGSYTGLNLERIDEDESLERDDDVSFQGVPGISVELKEL
jgi:hypothetical protein